MFWYSEKCNNFRFYSVKNYPHTFFFIQAMTSFNFKIDWIILKIGVLFLTNYSLFERKYTEQSLYLDHSKLNVKWFIQGLYWKHSFFFEFVAFLKKNSNKFHLFCLQFTDKFDCNWKYCVFQISRNVSSQIFVCFFYKFIEKKCANENFFSHFFVAKLKKDKKIWKMENKRVEFRHRNFMCLVMFGIELKYCFGRGWCWA